MRIFNLKNYYMHLKCIRESSKGGRLGRMCLTDSPNFSSDPFARWRSKEPPVIWKNSYKLGKLGPSQSFDVFKPVLRDVTPCNLVDSYERFGNICWSIFSRVYRRCKPTFWVNMLPSSSRFLYVSTQNLW